MKFRFHAIAFLAGMLGTPLQAAWQDEIGFTRLQTLVGGELPTAPIQGLTQVEAPESSGYYAPDTANALFTGKTFDIIPNSTGVSNHATHVARNFYGTSSQIPGSCEVDVYEVNSWAGAAFLNLGSTNEPAIETRAVQNHSWAGSFGSTSSDTELGRRVDYAINRDGFVCAVGLFNEDTNTPTHPQLLCQTYNTISVGRDDGGHTKGLTTLDGSGRMKPDIVAPSAAPEYATSWTTPMVAGTAGLLVAKLASAYSITGADKPRIAKALLLASATKNTVPGWDNSSTSPLDSIYGAGELNAYHAYSTLRTGRATASNSMQYGLRGWAAETLNGTSAKTYYFNIPAGAPSTPFSAALTWHRNITTSLSGGGPFQTRNWTPSLSNLRLRLHQANGFSPGVLIAESDSAVDNVELVYQSALAPGNYVIEVYNTSATSTPYALAWHSLPAVTVAATIPTAREIDGQQGQITVTRTGDTTLPLYVPLTIGGTATAGSHYQALPANITIPAGQSTHTLPVTPVSDSIAQGDRTVTVSVAADFTLVRDTSQSAVVTIQDKPFDAWRFANFTSTELGNSAVSGETADPDADQLANLIEYALALMPKSPNSSPVIQTDIGGYLALSVAKNTSATDITWGAEASDDLILWNPAVIVTDTQAAFEARDLVLMNAAAKRFIRLKITRP